MPKWSGLSYSCIYRVLKPSLKRSLYHMLNYHTLYLTVAAAFCSVCLSCTNPLQKQDDLAYKLDYKKVIWLSSQNISEIEKSDEDIEIYFSQTQQPRSFLVSACKDLEVYKECFHLRDENGDPLYFLLAKSSDVTEFRHHLKKAKKLVSSRVSSDAYSLSSPAAVAAPSLVQVLSAKLLGSSPGWLKAGAAAVIAGLGGAWVYQKSQGAFVPYLYETTTLETPTREALEKAYLLPASIPSSGPIKDPPPKKPMDVPPFLPLDPIKEEVPLIENPYHLDQETCLDIVYPEHSGDDLLQSASPSPSLPDVARCHIILEPALDAVGDSDVITQVRQRKERFYEDKQAHKQRDEECLNLLYPSKFSQDNHNKKGPFSPGRTTVDPFVVNYCNQHLEESPNQQQIEAYKTLYDIRENPPMKMGNTDEQGGVSRSSTSSAPVAQSHSIQRSLSFEEYCREVVYRLRGKNVSAEQEQHLGVCQNFLNHLKVIQGYIVTNPVSKEALEQSSWYRAKLQYNMKKRIEKKIIYQDHAQSPAQLSELKDILDYKGQLQQALQDGSDDESSIRSALSDVVVIQNYFSRLLEVEAGITNGSLRDHIDTLEASVDIQDSTQLDTFIKDVEGYIVQERKIAEIYRHVPIRESSLVLSPGLKDFLSVSMEENIDEVLYDQVKLHRLKVLLIESLANLRVEYFALLDGKKVGDYSAHEIHIMKLHKTLTKIDELPPGSTIDQNLVSSFMQEILGGLERAFPNHVQWQKSMKSMLFNELLSKQRHKLEKSLRGMAQNSSSSSFVHQSLGEQVFSLHILLTRIQHGIHDLESLEPNHFEKLHAVVHDPELSAFSEMDPYRDIGAQMSSSLAEDPTLKALEALRTLMKNTSRKHIAKNKRSRLFQFTHKPQHVTKQMKMNKILKEQMRQLAFAYYTLLYYSSFGEPAIRTRYITHSVSFFQDLPEEQSLSPDLIYVFFKHMVQGLEEHFKLPQLSREYSRLPDSLGERIRFIRLALKAIAHKKDHIYDLKPDELTDLATSKSLSQLRERPYTQMSLDITTKPKDHPLVVSLKELDAEFMTAIKTRFNPKRIIRTRVMPYSGDYNKLNRLYRGKEAKGFDGDDDLPQHAKL